MPPTLTGSNRLLGIRHSKGCVRIPASLNTFLDHYGILDAEYEALRRTGKSLWVLKSDRADHAVGGALSSSWWIRSEVPAGVGAGARQQGAREKCRPARIRRLIHGCLALDERLTVPV